MRLPAFPFRKWKLCIALTIAAAACLYPHVDRRIRLIFAEQALRERDAATALGWLKGVPDGKSQGQKEFLVARAYRRLGEMNQVRNQLEEAFKQGFPVERLEREQWLAMAQSGQMRDAEPYLRTLLQDPGEDGAEICEAYVSGYVRNREILRAMPIIDAWQADYPEDPLPHVILAGRHREMDHWSEAIVSYRKALELSPEDSHTRLQLAICLKTALKLQEAELEFRKCLEETPDDKELLAEWGDMLLSCGKMPEATAVFEHLLVIDPGNFSAGAAIGGIHLMNGRAEEAVAILGPLHKERPYDSKVLYSYASSLQAAGRAKEAAEKFQEVAAAEVALRKKKKLLDELDLCVDPVNQQFEIARIAMKHESPEEGLRWLLKVIDLNPEHVGAYAALADYYQKTGNAQLEKKYRALAESSGKTTDGP